MAPPMRTRVAMTARSWRLMVPSLRRSSADFLHQILLQDRIAERWRISLAPRSWMALWMSGLPAYFCTLRVRARSRSDYSPATWASITTPRVPMIATMSGLRSPSLVVMCDLSYTVNPLQDMVVYFRHHAPCTVAAIPVSPPGGSGSGRKSTDSYLVTVDIISAGKKCGSVRYPLMLVGNLIGVLKRTSFYQAVEESGPSLHAAFFVRNDGGSVGEPFVTLEDFIGQVGICDVCFITTWYEPEKAISPVERR